MATELPAMKNIRLQFARWDDLPPDIQAVFVQFAIGNRGDKSRQERGRALYELYFYWYNIPHEIGHVLRALFSTYSGKWDEETAVNQFAVSYWRAKGQIPRLLHLENEITQALAHIPDPVPANEDRAVYLERHHQELTDPASYAHYQFNMVRSAMAHPLDFSQALKRLITPQANDGTTIPLAPDFPLDEDLPYRTVEDMRRTLAAYDVHLPEVQIVCMYAPAIQFVTWDTETEDEK